MRDNSAEAPAAGKDEVSFISTLFRSQDEISAENRIELQRICTDQTQPFHTRKLAALLLLRTEDCLMNSGSAVLAAKIASQGTSHLICAWTQFTSQHGFPVDNDAYEFFSDLLRHLGKQKDVIFTSELAMGILYATVFYYSNNRGKESERFFPLLAKMVVKSREMKQEMVVTVLNEFSPGLQAKYDLLAALLKDDAGEIIAPHLSSILSELTFLSECQSLSSTCVSLLSHLLKTSHSTVMEDWMFSLATCTKRSTRVNVHRCWLGRLVADSSLHSRLLSLLMRIKDSFLSCRDPLLLPLSMENAHDLTCIDPYWRWEETNDVFWESDSLLFALISLLTVLHKRISSLKKEEWRSCIIKGAQWHLEEIRLKSLQLINAWKLTLSEEEYRCIVNANLWSDENEVITELSQIEHNAIEDIDWITEHAESKKVALEVLLIVDEDKGKEIVRRLLESEDEETRRYGRGIVDRREWNREKMRLWKETMDKDKVDEMTVEMIEWRQNEMEDEEKEELRRWIMERRNHSVATNLNDAIRIVLCDCCIPLIEESKSRIESLLLLSGSSSPSQCPSFTIFNKNVLMAGLTPKEFSDEMLSLLCLLTHSSSMGMVPPSEVSSIVFHVITRCRYKAVVDHGSNLFLSLIKMDVCLADEYFKKIIPLLSSSSTEARSLSFSRTLLSCCLICPSLIQQLEQSFILIMDTYSSSPICLVRWLKTIKLFLSKTTQTKLSSLFVEEVFFFCLHLQYSQADFLDKSAAMCLFSFCSLVLIGPFGCPLFILISNHSHFMNEVITLIHQLPSLPPIASTLLLSFISRLDYVTDAMYSQQWADMIDSARSDIRGLLLKTWKKRERRFIVDAFVALTPHSQKEELRREMGRGKGEEEEEEDAMQYLREMINGKNELSESKVHEVYCRSGYYSRVWEGVNGDSTDSILQIKMEDEQSRQAVCIGLSDMGRKGLGRENNQVKHILEQLSSNERPRVRSLAQRAIREIHKIE